MNTPIDITNSSVENRKGQLVHLLAALQFNLEDLKNEVDRSYALYEIGEKTDLLQKIEQMLDNPIQSIFDLSNDVDGKAKDIINQLVKAFFRQNKELIHKAGKANSFSGSLYYAIVLKEDSTDNRSEIFDFFDHYDFMEISNKFPVYFQFVPKHLEDKVRFTEVFDL